LRHQTGTFAATVQRDALLNVDRPTEVVLRPKDRSVEVQ
jgi:hypothetical protein